MSDVKIAYLGLIGCGLGTIVLTVEVMAWNLNLDKDNMGERTDLAIWVLD